MSISVTDGHDGIIYSISQIRILPQNTKIVLSIISDSGCEHFTLTDLHMVYLLLFSKGHLTSAYRELYEGNCEGIEYNNNLNNLKIYTINNGIETSLTIKNYNGSLIREINNFLTTN